MTTLFFVPQFNGDENETSIKCVDENQKPLFHTDPSTAEQFLSCLLTARDRNGDLVATWNSGTALEV